VTRLHRTWRLCFGRLAVLLAFCIASSALFWPVVGQHRRTFFAFHDNVVQSYPWMVKLVRSWQAGEVPLWDFETHAGTSFIGELQTAPLYPPHIAFALLRVPVTQDTLDLYVVLHFGLGAFLLFVFLRQNRIAAPAALVGALLGFFVGAIGQRAAGQTNLFFGLVWIPATLAFGQRALAGTSWARRVVWAYAAAGSLALSLLAGHPVPAIFSILALVVLPPPPSEAPRPSLRARLLVVGLVILLFSSLAAPQLLPTVEYMAHSYRWVGGPNPVWGLAPAPYSVYAHAEVLQLAELRDLLWPLGSLRDGGTLFVTVTGLVLALLGAARWTPLSRFGLALAVPSIAIALGGHTPVGLLAYITPLVNTVREPIRFLMLYQMGMAVLAALGAELLIARSGRVSRALAPVVGVALLGSLGLELAYHARGLTGPCDSPGTVEHRYAPSATLAFLERVLQQGPQRFRVLNLDNTAIPANSGDAIPGIRTTMGHRATMYRPFFDYLCRDWSPTSPNFDRLAARYVVAAREVAGLGLVFLDGELRIYERPHALPVLQLESPDGRLSPAPLRAARWRESSVEIELNPGASGRLVLSQAAYPGWTATVDGHSRGLETSDVFTALRLGSTDHKVRLAYRPLSFAAGIACLLLALCGLGATLWVKRPWRCGCDGPTAEEPQTALSSSPGAVDRNLLACGWLSAALRAIGSVWRRAPWTLGFLVVVAAIALALATWDLTNPGLQYDEVLFANAAAGAPTDTFIHLRFAGVPVLLMEYLGALKAWLYRPVFAFLPVNEWTLRVPAIILGLAGGALLVAALWRLFGKSAALLGAPLILLDPTLITASRLDWGPNALMFLCRGLLVFSLAAWISDGRPRWAWLALAATSAGIFDKLSFLWCTYGAIGALALVYPDRVARLARQRRGTVAALGVLGLGSVALATARAVALDALGAEPTGWTHHVVQVAQQFELVVAGGGVLDYVAGDGLRLAPLIWPAYVLCALAALLGVRGFLVGARRRAWLFLVALSAITAASLLATRSATGPHHVAVVAGFLQMLLAPLLAASLNSPGKWWKALPAATGVLVLSGGFIAANVVCLRAFTAPTNPNWDRANTHAARFACTHPEATFLTTDWGMGNQIIALSSGRAKVNDDWPSLVELESARDVLRRLDPRQETYVMSRLPGFEPLKANRQVVLAALAAEKIPFETAAVFTASSGRPMIEVLRLWPESARSSGRPER
jgi:hypothetical protein